MSNTNLNPRVLENIDFEAYLHVRDGAPIGGRGPQYDEYTKEAVERAKLRLEEERLEKVIGKEKKLAAAWGMDYDEWLKLARKLYTITPDCRVISIANGPDHQREWQEDSESAARDRVVALIRIKKYDHFVRGYDFRYKPE